MSTLTPTPAKHLGRNVKRIREIMQVKQEVLADALGITQQSVSLLEQKEHIDVETLELIAKTLKVPAETIRNFNEESAFNVISNTFSSHDHSTLNAVNYHCNINPFEKWLEAIEENKKLYEALLKSEREKVAILERLLEKK